MLSFAAASTVSPALAQSPAAEIVVTAQKREQDAGSIGLSVSVLGPSDLAALGQQDVAGLVRRLPGVQLQSYSPTSTVFNIRGVSQNDYADSQEAPVAFYEDEVYVGALGAISGRTFDLARIEVLRGPQGALFGRNATGGLVQFVSAKPTATFESYATLTATEDGAAAVEGAVGGPINAQLRARLAILAQSGGAYIRNRSGRDLGGQRSLAGRLQIAADVGAAGTVLLKASALRDHDRRAGLYSHAAAAPDGDGLGRFVGGDENPFGTCGGCDALGYREPDTDPFTGGFDDPIRFDRTFHAVTGRYEGDLGEVRVTAIGDYQHLRKDYAEDADMSPASTLVLGAFQRLSQVSQELRLARESGPLTWVAGVYGLRIRSYNRYRVDAGESLGIDERFGGTLATSSLAGFGQVEYALAPAVRLIAGLRYTRDRKTYRFMHAENGVADLLFTPATYPALARRTFGAWTGKVQIEWRPAPALLVYGGVDRGAKSGGFGAPAQTPGDPTTIAFGQEVLTSYQAGFKWTIGGGAAHLDFAAFRYRYRDYQAFELVDLALAIRNKDASVGGFELSADVRPFDGLTLAGSLALLDAIVEDVVLPSGRVADRRMPQAPRASAIATIRYDRPVGSGSVRFETNWKFDSAQYFSTFNAPVDRDPGRAVGDARVSYSASGGRWTAAAFVDNLSDRRYRLYNLDFSTSFGFAQSTYARPRRAGISLTVRAR